jgi:holin-like protein
VLGGFLVLLFFQLLGELLARWMGLPLPGPVLGLALLVTFISTGFPLPRGLNLAAGGLLDYMALLFIPAGVGVITYLPQLKAAWLPILVSLVGSTILALVVTALVVKGVLLLLARRVEAP